MMYSTDDYIKDPLELNFGTLSDSNENIKYIRSIGICDEIPFEQLQCFLSNENSTLYIIGNGFDLHHKLKTQYVDFKNFLKTSGEYEFLDALSLSFNLTDDKEFLWQDLEETIKKCISIPYSQSIHPSEQSKSYTTEQLVNKLNFISKNIDSKFYDWIKSIENTMNDNISLDYNFKKFNFVNSLFLSYNYTNVLEDYYNISSEQIFHIHGSFSESIPETLYVGFGDSNFKVLSSYHNLITKISADSDSDSIYKIDYSRERKGLDPVTESALTGFLDYFTSRNKLAYISDTKLYDYVISVLNKMHSIENVVVLGHSFGPSDSYSLKLLRDRLQNDNVKWYIGVKKHSDLEYVKNYTRMIMYKMYISPNQVKFFYW